MGLARCLTTGSIPLENPAVLERLYRPAPAKRSYGFEGTKIHHRRSSIAGTACSGNLRSGEVAAIMGRANRAGGALRTAG